MFQLDAFQINFIISINLITVQIVVSVIQSTPIIPLFAMITSTSLILSGVRMAGTFFLYYAKVKIPVRISSLPAGHIVRPAVYTLIEDIIAVNGGAGTKYREELNARYEASPLFRRMLNRLDGFWGFGALTTAATVTALLWTIKVEYIYWAGMSSRLECFNGLLMMQFDVHRICGTFHMGGVMGISYDSICALVPR